MARQQNWSKWQNLNMNKFHCYNGRRCFVESEFIYQVEI